MQFEKLPITSITVDEDFNCRGKVSDFEVRDLMKSIETYGLLEPVVVCPIADGFKLIAGFRRFKALSLLEYTEIPCIIKEVPLPEQAIINLEENIQRSNLNVLQEAFGLEHLIKSGVPFAEISKRLRVSSHWISIRQKLLQMPGEIQAKAATGDINTGDILRLSKISLDFEKIKAMKELLKIRKENEDMKKRLGIRVVNKTENKQCKRGLKDIEKLISYLYNNFGPGLYLIVLRWAAGFCSDNELEMELKIYAEQNKKEYAKFN